MPDCFPVSSGADSPTGIAQTGNGFARCSWRRDVRLVAGARIVVMWLAGDLDLSTYPVLADALDASHQDDPAAVVVDLSAVGFCACRGLGMIASTSAAVPGTRYALSGLSAHLDRVHRLLSAHNRLTLPRYPSAALAVHALQDPAAS